MPHAPARTTLRQNRARRVDPRRSAQVAGWSQHRRSVSCGRIRRRQHPGV